MNLIVKILQFAMAGAVGGWATAIGAALVIGDWPVKGLGVAIDYVLYGIVIGAFLATIIGMPVILALKLDRIPLITVLFCFATSGVIGGLAWGLTSRLHVWSDSFAVILVTVSAVTLAQLFIWNSVYEKRRCWDASSE